jgi:hypothetical protein
MTGRREQRLTACAVTGEMTAIPARAELVNRRRLPGRAQGL